MLLCFVTFQKMKAIALLGLPYTIWSSGGKEAGPADTWPYVYTIYIYIYIYLYLYLYKTCIYIYVTCGWHPNHPFWNFNMETHQSFVHGILDQELRCHGVCHLRQKLSKIQCQDSKLTMFFINSRTSMRNPNWCFSLPAQKFPPSNPVMPHSSRSWSLSTMGVPGLPEDKTW